METGLPIPAEIKPLIDAVMENVGLAAVVSTDEQKQLIAAQMQAAQAAAQQQMQQGAGEQVAPEEMPAEEQPPLPEQ
jgi:hypothetical protein